MKKTMTNKLKKEIDEFVGEMCEDGNLKVNPDDFYKFIKNIEKQAKLSQKQEDDERFEEFIKKLKKEVLENKDKETNISAIGTYGFFLDRIDKLAEELKGEQKQ